MTIFSNAKTAAVIVAAGSGKRIGGSVKKQFIEIGGKPVIRLTLEKFQGSTAVTDIILVVPPQAVEEMKSQLPKWGVSKVSQIVAGGAERPESVAAGLACIDESVECVLIHDGVRPFVKLEEIEKVVAASLRTGAAVLGVPPKDTIKQIAGDFVVKTLNRSELFAAQTPQGFRRNLIIESMGKADFTKTHFTDDCSVVESLGHKVAIVNGGYHNIKITTPDDIAIGELLLRMEETDENR